jgi:hypothetical protein
MPVIRIKSAFLADEFSGFSATAGTVSNRFAFNLDLTADTAKLISFQKLVCSMQ